MHYWVNALFSVSSNKELPFSQEEKQRHRPGADQKAEAELGQQQDPSVEVDAVMDVVNHLSQVGGIIFCWKKYVIRKQTKNKQEPPLYSTLG